MGLQHRRQRLRHQLIRHAFAVALGVRDVAERPADLRADAHVGRVLLQDHDHVLDRTGGAQSLAVRVVVQCQMTY